MQNAAQNSQSNKKSNPLNLGLNNRYTGVVLSVLLLVIVVFIAWRSINYITGRRTAYDSSIFSGIARHMMEGRILYRDVWDTKPPMVFLINLCALKMGDATINAVQFAERIFAVAGGLLIFGIVLAVFDKLWLAFLAAVCFLLHLYHPLVFSGGNLTEEYGAVFLLGAIAAAFASRLLNRGLCPVMVFVSGFVFSLAALCKETFMLSALPWLVYVAWPRDKKYKSAVVYAALFVVGALAPVVILAVWLLANDALLDWGRTILHSFGYVSRKQPFNLFMSIDNAYKSMASALVVTRIAAVLGLASLFDMAFVRKYHYLPFAIAASTFTGFAATCLSGRYYGHYYMQVIPCYVLLGACGAAFASKFILPLIKRPFDRVFVILFLVAGITFIDIANFKFFAQCLAKPARRWKSNELGQFIRGVTNPTDKIWTPSFPHTHLYVDTGRLSPTKWLVFIEGFPRDSAYGTRKEKINSLSAQLAHDPPRIIVISNAGLTILERYGLTKWLKEKYELFLDSEQTFPRASQIWIYAE